MMKWREVLWAAWCTSSVVFYTNPSFSYTLYISFSIFNQHIEMSNLLTMGMALPVHMSKLASCHFLIVPCSCHAPPHCVSVKDDDNRIGLSLQPLGLSYEGDRMDFSLRVTHRINTDNLGWKQHGWRCLGLTLRNWFVRKIPFFPTTDGL